MYDTLNFATGEGVPTPEVFSAAGLSGYGVLLWLAWAFMRGHIITPKHLDDAIKPLLAVIKRQDELLDQKDELLAQQNRVISEEVTPAVADAAESGLRRLERAAALLRQLERTEERPGRG